MINIKHQSYHIYILLIITLIFSHSQCIGKNFTETSYLVVNFKTPNLNTDGVWNFIKSDLNSGIAISVQENKGVLSLQDINKDITFLIDRLYNLTNSNSSRIIPVFINFKGNISILDSTIRNSKIAPYIFFLPIGEAWPQTEYLIQSNRRILFFISGDLNSSRGIFHPTNDYIFSISASSPSTNNLLERIDIPGINLELLKVDNFNHLPIDRSAMDNLRNLVPDYINFLLENWTKYGKKPNFIFVDKNISNYDFIVPHLNTFTWVSGSIKSISGKTLDNIFWKNPDILVTGGRFSFPYRGGEELTLTPFAPGYTMIPQQIIVTGEMEIPDSYHIIGHPLKLGEGLTAKFNFNNSLKNQLSPNTSYSGENYSFSQDIDRGIVLRLPEQASVNLGSPDNYGLRNSNFTVSCFVKFNEILEFGDNAILGNYESEYRRGLHLVLRSGHPYFGLWANDFISGIKLSPDKWYHLAWRYIIETGEQAIFLNGKILGSSCGHPPFSGTTDIHLGSAIYQGASMRGYIDDLHIWNRPLATEEITKLALNEEIDIKNKKSFFTSEKLTIKSVFVLLSIIVIIVIIISINKKNRSKNNTPSIYIPQNNQSNQINLFGSFNAINNRGENISNSFTPKVKELYLFIFLSTLKNGIGAPISEIDKYLWPGISQKKISNNRAVTLNKLRKILTEIDGIEIITQPEYLQAKLTSPLFCDYYEAYHLCQLSDGMNRNQLESFFSLIKKGRFLKGLSWPWLDGMRGYTGTQIIDNLLKLAVYYIDKKNLPKVEAIAKRILEYDDLNEEATYLHIWTQLKAKNTHQAKFYFNMLCTKYKKSMGESFPFDYEKFISIYKAQIATIPRLL